MQDAHATAVATSQIASCGCVLDSFELKSIGFDTAKMWTRGIWCHLNDVPMEFTSLFVPHLLSNDEKYRPGGALGGGSSDQATSQWHTIQEYVKDAAKGIMSGFRGLVEQGACGPSKRRRMLA